MRLFPTVASSNGWSIFGTSVLLSFRKLVRSKNENSVTAYARLTIPRRQKGNDDPGVLGCSLCGVTLHGKFR